MRRVIAVVMSLAGAVCVQSLSVAQASEGARPPASRQATVTLVHLNDIYEIQPIEGGRFGGPARVATVVRRLKETATPVVTTLGGDYLSPSALGTARVDGQPLAGRQMVDVLNLVGVDLATFGNHEFDVSEEAFRAHLIQARFRIVSTNVTDAEGKPFPGVPTSTILRLKVGERTIRLGVIGICVGSTRKPWVRYRDGIVAAREEIARITANTDAIVALTHLPLEDDIQFVNDVPGVDVVLGGHEHENWLIQRGPGLVPIIKADANVRTLAIVSMTFGDIGTRPTITSRLQLIDDAIASAPDVEARAREWTDKGFAAFRQDGFTPEALVATSTELLDGRESVVRNRPGRLTDLIAEALALEAGRADVGLFAGGSVRIDDVVPAGPITQYDIIRILPFGGKVVKATLQGALLARVLETGMNNQGLGGYLHVWGARQVGTSWEVGGKRLDPSAHYVVAMNDFLLTGGEVNLGFLTRTNPLVHDVADLRDIRRVVIEALARRYPPSVPASR